MPIGDLAGGIRFDIPGVITLVLEVPGYRSARGMAQG